MERNRTGNLEYVIGYELPKNHWTRLYNPRPSVISADYLKSSTIEPLDEGRIGDYVYSVRIKKGLAEWRRKEFKGCLVVSLLEKNVKDASSTKLSAAFPLPAREDVSWVRMIAANLAYVYGNEKSLASGKILEIERMLMRLVAGRVEFYKMGGRSYKFENRKN